jgi:hypothetical protein
MVCIADKGKENTRISEETLRKLCGWRGTILDRTEGSIVDKRCGQTAWCDNALGSYQMPGKAKKWQAGNGGECGMRSRTSMVSPQTRVGFGRIQCRLQVVGDGNDWEQNQKEHSQGHKLHPSTRTDPRLQSHPEAEHQGGKHNPGEIEVQLHS